MNQNFTINYENAAGVKVEFWVLKSITSNPIAQNQQGQQKELTAMTSLNVLGYVSKEAFEAGKKAVQAKNLLIPTDETSDSIKATLQSAIQLEKEFKDLQWQTI